MKKNIQRRISDNIDFDRDWNDYVDVFGEVDESFWMELEEIHQHTTTYDVSLYIDIETYEGEPFTLKLETFSVGNAESNYAWNISGFSQSPDRIKGQIFPDNSNGMMFTTRDRDNDRRNTINCAADVHRGGWWYHRCTYINLNGNYECDVTPTKTGILVRYIDTTDNSYTW